jgi:pyruvate dehydrogenase E1 component
MAAADLLKSDFGVVADIWSATSFNELRRDGMAVERWSLLHPTEKRRQSWVEVQLAGHDGPVIASTDYMRMYADQIREYVQAAGRRYVVLGTDGFGRSDYRKNLRRFFEVDRYYVVVAALKALSDDGALKPSVAAQAITKYELDAGRAAPWTL